MVGSAVLSFLDVVGLEAVGAVAALDRALIVVAPLHISTDVAGGWLLPYPNRRPGVIRR